MPHSSGGGGGSFGGGFSGGHSSSSTRSGGHNSAPTPVITKHRTSHTKHRYVYYHNHHPYYYYSDLPITKSSIIDPWKSLALAGCIFGIFFMVIFLLVSYRFTPSKCDQSNADIVIDDKLNVLDHEDELKQVFKQFQQITGVAPAFVSVNNHVGESSLEDYSYDYYVSHFYDEEHWLIAYSENDRYYYWMGMQGDDTDSILDDWVLDQFNEQVNTGMEYNQNINTTLVEAFNDLNGYVTYHGITSPILHNVGIASGIIGVVSLIALVLLSYKDKNDCLVEMTSSKKHNEDVTAFCPHCNGEYVLGLHDTCPYCGEYLGNQTSIEDDQLQTY